MCWKMVFKQDSRTLWEFGQHSFDGNLLSMKKKIEEMNGPWRRGEKMWHCFISQSHLSCFGNPKTSQTSLCDPIAPGTGLTQEKYREPWDLTCHHWVEAVWKARMYTGCFQLSVRHCLLLSGFRLVPLGSLYSPQRAWSSREHAHYQCAHLRRLILLWKAWHDIRAIGCESFKKSTVPMNSVNHQSNK